MLAPSATFRRVLLGGLCASALVMGACSGGDKAPAEEIIVDAGTLELSGANAEAMERHFSVEPRDGDAAETLERLDVLGLADMTEGRAIDGSTATFTDWRATEGNSEVTAARVVLRGLHETQDGLTKADAIEIEDIRVRDYETDTDGVDRDTIDASADRIVLVDPSPQMTGDIALVLRGYQDSSTPDAVNDLSNSMDFRALWLEGLEAEVDEMADPGHPIAPRSGTLAVGQLIVGNDEETELLDMVLETVSFRWGQGEAQDGSEDEAAEDDRPDPFTLDMDGLTLMGLDTDQLSGSVPRGAGAVAGLAASAFAFMAPTAKPPYRQVDLGRMSVSSSLFDLDTDGFEADTQTEGDTVVMRTVLEPLALAFKDVSATPLGAHMEALRENGLDVVTLKGAATTTFDAKADRVRVTDGRTEIDEGLRMSCDYSVLGMNAATDALEASGLTPPTFEMSDGEDPQAVMDKYMADAQAYSTAQAEANALIRLEGLDCDVQDVAENSLVTRGYAVASAVTGKPVAVLKGGAKTMIALSSLTAQSEFQRDLMDTVGSGLIDFIDTPGQTMTVTMAPETPVALTSLTGQDGTEPSLAPLGLSVEVK
ncbi:MAG: hypothetical protein AAF311_10140 [Pseudomonadota bacterium]